MSSPATRRGRLVGAAVLLALLAASLTGLVDRGLDAAGRQRLVTSDRAFLETSRGDAEETLVVLSAFAAGLDMLSTSRAGISLIVDVDVEVGQVLKPLGELVGKASLGSLLGLMAITGLELLLDLASHAAGPVLSAALALLLLQRLLTLRGAAGPLSAAGARLGRTLLVPAVAAHLLVPLAVGGASFLSHEITAPRRAALHDAFLSTHDAVLGKQAKKETHERVESAFHRYEDNIEHIPSQTRTLAGHVPEHLALVAFDALVFPLGSLWLLVALMRRLVSRRVAVT